MRHTHTQQTKLFKIKYTKIYFYSPFVVFFRFAFVVFLAPGIFFLFSSHLFFPLLGHSVHACLRFRTSVQRLVSDFLRWVCCDRSIFQCAAKQKHNLFSAVKQSKANRKREKIDKNKWNNKFIQTPTCILWARRVYLFDADRIEP